VSFIKKVKSLKAIKLTSTVFYVEDGRIFCEEQVPPETVNWGNWALTML
jgi:hypothetical protein